MPQDDEGHTRPRRAARRFGLAAALALLAPGGHAATVILPVGDSITEGTSSFGFSASDYPESAWRLASGGPPADLRSYREHLHDLLIDPACGADVEWVGARRATGRVPEKHDGHSGWHASYFDIVDWKDVNGVHPGRKKLAGWVATFAPDVVTLHVGTNGLGRSRTASQNADDIAGILDDVHANAPGATVFLANVIPISGWWGDRATTLAASRPTVREEARVLTGLIGNLAAERRARGRDVVLVDVNSEFYLDESNPVRCPAATGGDPNNMTMQVCVSDPDGGGGTIPDALHPGLRGDRFIAERFHAAMRAEGLCEAPPPPADGCDVTANRVTVADGEWHMLGLPCVPPADADTVADVLGDDVPGVYGTDWIVFAHDPSIAPPASPYVDPGLDGRLRPGQGFWFIQESDADVTLDMPAGSRAAGADGTRGCSSGSCTMTPLADSSAPFTWTMVGNPHPAESPVAFDDLRLVTDGGVCASGCSIPDATDAGLTREGFFRYDGRRYAPLVTDGATLGPWESYWVATVPGANGASPELAWPAR